MQMYHLIHPILMLHYHRSRSITTPESTEVLPLLLTINHIRITYNYISSLSRVVPLTVKLPLIVTSPEVIVDEVKSLRKHFRWLILLSENDILLEDTTPSDPINCINNSHYTLIYQWH